MAGERLSVRLDDDARAQVDELVQESGQSESEIVREAIGLLHQKRRRRAPARRPETAYDVLKRHGLIGCIKDAPADLRTNPKNMEGFGRD